MGVLLAVVGLIGTVSVASTTPTPSPTPMPAKPIARGLINLLGMTNSPPPGLTKTVDMTGNPTLPLSYIDGERIRTNWITIQPDTTGNPVTDSQNYDWGWLDIQIAIAAAHGKYIGLSIGAGIYTPNWVYVGNPTVYKFVLDVSDDDEIENGFQPFPWDLSYLSKWKTFVAAFGAKYDGNPTVRYIVMTGMQQFNQLFFIKNADASQSFNDGLTTGTTNLHSATANFVAGDVGKIISGVNIQEGSVVTARINSTDVTLDKTTTAASGATFWIEERVTGSDDGDDFKVNELAKHHPAGPGSWPDYSDVDPATGDLRHASTAAYIAGAKEIIDAFQTAFPHTELILSAAKPFPDANEYTKDTKETVKLYGETTYPPLVGEMGTGLRAKTIPPFPTPTPKPVTVPYGQQALHPSSYDDIYLSPAPNPRPPPPQPLIDMMYNGWQQGVNWLELYQSDTANDDPAAVAALQDYHTRLTGAALSPTSAQPLNISTRMEVRTGDQALIGGFIITGNAPKRVVLRAIGPSLAGFGIANPLADPILELHGADGSLITTNDNWKDTQQSEIETIGFQPQNDLESAIVSTLDPGNYTAIVSGKGGSTGVGLVEGYDLDQAADSQLTNISTRGFVETGSNVMIGGFILGAATGNANVLIRALGPSLTQLGVTAALADPTLELHDANGALIRSDDNWKETQQSEIEATGLQPQNDLESAFLETLAPGVYTAIVAGNGGLTGVALVEVYRLP